MFKYSLFSISFCIKSGILWTVSFIIDLKLFNCVLLIFSIKLLGIFSKSFSKIFVSFFIFDFMFSVISFKFVLLPYSLTTFSNNSMIWELYLVRAASKFSAIFSYISVFSWSEIKLSKLFIISEILNNWDKLGFSEILSKIFLAEEFILSFVSVKFKSLNIWVRFPELNWCNDSKMLLNLDKIFSSKNCFIASDWLCIL